jgi:hypothetical protein
MPATIASQQPKAIYSQNSSNMAIKADLDELAKQGRTDNPCELNKTLLQKYLEYKERDYQDWIEKLNTGQMIANLTEGKLVPMRHARTGQMRLVKPDGRWSDNKTVGGKFQFYITNLLAEWLSSRPARDPICPSDQDQIEAFIDNVKIVQDYYDRKFFSTDYEKKEFASLANFGTSITRIKFDPELGDLVCELLPFPACRWDMRMMAEDSPYFIYESKCATSVLQHLLDIDINEDDVTDNYGLQLMEQITRQGTGVRGEGKDRLYGTYVNVPGETIVTEMWLQPEVYCDISLSFPEKTVSGKTIPKGKSLLELFPKGLCVIGINNMQTIIGLYAENHRDHIVSGIYHDRAFSGVGKGVDDAVDVYKELNDLHSQLLTYVKAHSTPAYGYNKDMVSEADARDIGKARKNIPFDFTNAPDGVRSVNDAIQAIVPSNPAMAGFQYKAELEKDLQSAFQVTAFSEGLPGVNNETATGAKIGESLAMKQLLPQHLNKASQRMRADKVIYINFKRHVNKPKWFASRSKNGITAGKYLTGDDFADVDIDFEIVANSEAPKTPFADEQSLSRLMQFTGGMAGLWEMSQQDPDFTDSIVTAFGIQKLPIMRTPDIARICRKRIEQAKEMLEQELATQQIMTAVTGQPLDNTNLAASIVSQLMPPISPKEMYADQKAKWMAELLDSDEMQYAPEELRYVIEEMISVQLQADTLGQAQVGMDTNLGMIMARLPELVGEQVMNYQNQQLEQEYAASQEAAKAQQQEGQEQAQVGAEVQKATVTDKLSERDHERAMEMEAFKQEGQQTQAKLQNQRAKQAGTKK